MARARRKGYGEVRGEGELGRAPPRRAVRPELNLSRGGCHERATFLKRSDNEAEVVSSDRLIWMSKHCCLTIFGQWYEFHRFDREGNKNNLLSSS